MKETTRPSLIPSLSYRDPKAALDWLEKVFGFEAFMVITESDGSIVHSEMKAGDNVLMVGPEWTEKHCSPVAVGGKNTQTLHVQLADGIDAHCARAKACGATILMEPEDQFYGDRSYRVADLEGHIWSFGQTIRDVSREEAEAASGLKIEGWI